MKHITHILALAALASFFVGCNPPADDKGATKTTPTAEKKATGDKPKIGFIVKSMSDSWFQIETQFAKEKADEIGADLVVQEATKGEAVISTIDTMATNGVQGIIICAPEVQIGAAIKAATDKHNMKLMSVDDRLVDAAGKPLADVPHLGIAAANIGKQAGTAMADEMKKRNWKPEEVALLTITVPGLATAKDRIQGAVDALMAVGFKKENIFDAPWTGAADVAAASDAANAVLTAHSGFKHWIVCSHNDDGVLGGVRSLSNKNISPDNIIGVGINGKLAADEWAKGQPTGLVGSVMLQPKIHGAHTVELMAKWIKDGTKPDAETFTDGTVINKDNYKEELKKAGIK